MTTLKSRLTRALKDDKPSFAWPVRWSTGFVAAGQGGQHLVGSRV